MKGKILFSTSGVTEGIQERLGEFIGVTSADLPTVRIVSPEGELKKFMYPGDVSALTVDDVEGFVNDFLTGKLNPHRKSEPVPETNDGPVYIVVGTEWDKVVKDPSKDVLMEYYAPWCGHCKALAPKYDELGEHIKGLDDLIVGKMDATANEVEGLEIKGYPTLKWYPKGDKSGQDYSEGREVDDFKAFFKKNSASYAEKFGVEEVAAPDDADKTKEEL